FADLGSEHLAHAIFRRTRAGGAIVAWGERMLEWPLERPQLREVVPRKNGAEYSNGGCALDVDGDGVDEIVVARGRTRSCSDPDLYWFKQLHADASWAEQRIAHIGNVPIAPHDINRFSARRPDGSKVRGVVAVVDRRQLVWYEIPADPTGLWPKHEIAELPLKSQSGIAVGDIAGNGRSDVACGMFWAECPSDPIQEPWKVRRFGHWEDGGWGGMAKLELADLNGDGLPEIVASEAEIPNARLGIFSRDQSKPDGLWQYREIESGLYCPHSLVLADLDGDARTDIVTGEMTAGGWSFPLNPHPRILAFLNHGDQAFERHVLAEGLGVHEMGSFPDKQKDALTLFAADEIQQKLPEMKTHISTWTIELSTRRIGK
ncbi:MAG TPA: VCBS repeat-containing protein, partial [Planctomycetaceae bacterium]|nr:VCBS repeat-containing protein [Planctomycetaceae bacterium]